MPNPLYRREFHWLRARFTEPYELVYVDPLLCDSSVWTGWTFLPFKSRVPGLPQQAFIKRIAKAIGARPEDSNVSTFLQPDGAGMRFKVDRSIQTKAQQETQKHWKELTSRTYLTVRSFANQRHAIRRLCNQPRADSLVAVDGMLGKMTHVPASIRFTYEQASLNDMMRQRNAECVLADYPAPLLTLRNPAIPLVVDQNAFYNWTEEFYAILNTGWYPLTRVIGLAAMNSGGTPFINVMAICVCPCPTFDVLLQPVGNDDDRCLPGTLQYVQRMSLTQAIQDAATAVTKRLGQNGNNGTGTSGAQPPARGRVRSGVGQNGTTRSGETATGTVPPGQVSIGPAQTQPAQTGTGQTAAVQSGEASTGAAPSDQTTAGAAQTSTAQNDSTQTGAAPTDAAQSNTAQSGEATTGAAQTSGSPMGTGDRLGFEYRRDEEFLSPLLFFQLGCRLNSVTHEALKERAGNAYNTAVEYLTALHTLCEQLEKLQISTQLTDYKDQTIESMLPAPETTQALALKEP